MLELVVPFGRGAPLAFGIGQALSGNRFLPNISDAADLVGVIACSDGDEARPSSLRSH